MLDHTLGAKHRVSTFGTNHNGLMPARRQLVDLREQDFATFEVARIGLPGAEAVILPDIAIVGAIGEAHLADLGSLQGIARLKAQLIKGVRPGGVALVNADSPYVSEVFNIADEQGVRVTTYGEHAEADLRLLSFNEASGLCRASVLGEQHEYTISLTGRHNAVNSLAVLGVLVLSQLPMQNYLEALSSFTARKRRGRTFELVIEGKHITIADESFNANPTSMKSTLAGFGATYPDRRKTLVLGDMAELGPSSPYFHAALATDIAATGADRVLLVGDSMSLLTSLLPSGIEVAHFNSVGELAEHGVREFRDGEAVLVKASNATGLGAAVSAWSTAAG